MYLRLLKRHIRDIHVPTFMIMYKTYVRSHLEYCVLGSPHLKQDFDCLKRIQRRATKLVPELKHLSCHNRLEKLGLMTLENDDYEETSLKPIKFLQAKNSSTVKTFFTLNDETYNLRGHPYKLQKYRSRQNVRKLFLQPMSRWHLEQVTISRSWSRNCQLLW